VSPPPAANEVRLPSNPSPVRSSSRLPRARGWSNGRIAATALIAFLVVGSIVVGVLWKVGAVFGGSRYTGLTIPVVRERLKITIIARGSLESAKNNDIICRVKSGTKGSTNSTSIKWLVDNGTPVEEGEKIMELDDSGLKEQLKSQNIVVDGARADEIAKAEQYRIDEIQCTSDLEKAINARDLAKLDLEKYMLGDYVQALKSAEGSIETAMSDLENWKDRSSWSQRMLKKGLVSKVQADADVSRVDGARIALDTWVESKRVLVDYTKKRTIQDLTAKVNEAERNIGKTKIQNKATLASDTAIHNSKKSIYEQELSKKREIEAEIAKCIITAPQAGLVVYYVPEQVRGGGGSQQSVVAQGEPVRESQKMMQIPDLDTMLVNVKVPEAFVSHLVEKTRQAAQIRVDALPGQTLHGHIKSVDTVASQTDWFASDVKVYKTMIRIDGQPEGLRPGMSAEVTIYADESDTDVLVVPVQAVVGSISMGAKRQVFVIGEDGRPVKRDIVVGMTNERKVEVKSGLEEGERVVENPAPLLGDNTDMKAGKVRAKAESDGGEAGEGKKKGGKKKGNGSPSIPGAPSGAPAGKGFGGAAPSSEQLQQLQQMKQKMLEKARNSSPAERREMLNNTPDAFRPQLQQLMQDNKLEIGN
jgi:HlyD family secretion protein